MISKRERPLSSEKHSISALAYIQTTLKVAGFALGTALLASCAGVTKVESKTVSATQDKIFSLPYHMETLDNGLKVIVVKTDYPDFNLDT